MYDFVLFENFHLAFNHYKDICLIAKMLVASGYSVAIADVFDEANSCVVEGVPHITINASKPKVRKTCNIPVFRVLENHVQTLRRWRYLTNVIKELVPICKNIYAGSYHVGLSLSMIKAVPPEKNIFFWGLRSSRLYEFKLHKDWNSWNCYRVIKYVESHSNVSFFVSDEMIKQEFIQLGINQNRLVIRPERTIQSLAIDKNIQSHACLKLLSIGTLRPQKRIELILSALKDIKDIPVEYTIAGRADKDYEEIIQKSMQDVKFVQRRNYRLSEEEYNLLIEDCDFLILCDRKSASNITNGTLNEALLKGKAIIAPNYEPYKSIVEKYGVGLLFEDQDLASLCAAVASAYNKRGHFFYENIVNYQKTLLFSRVVEQFKKEMSQCLKWHKG